ncbi:hypothetical protein [Sphaerospermopsis sp. LEGE 08334]|jgi:uncharacterized membrane protein|uniref:hypothetical protein n=1 Tax=Sphaerospermopsis sp. LEGE 08334 TaxID=1828651 RepID=UPI00187F1C04|nr:hypothetical protein [Sphaerospermopsis sp. LEGE 08334]MBE9058125.1 hypothetical protein [Sphaerospermopsis sp. LEGE 08334]
MSLILLLTPIFKQHQRGWAIAGMIIGAPVSITIWVLAFISLFNQIFDLANKINNLKK